MGGIGWHSTLCISHQNKDEGRLNSMDEAMPSRERHIPDDSTKDEGERPWLAGCTAHISCNLDLKSDLIMGTS